VHLECLVEGDLEELYSNLDEIRITWVNFNNPNEI